MLTTLPTLAATLPVQATEYPELTQEWFWNIPAYAPAKISINYVYTHNHSIYDISSLGTTSLYRHSGGPTNILFEADDYDTYRYTVELLYNNIIEQHLVVGIWSGTQQVQPNYEYHFYTVRVIIHVTLQVTEQPQFPTAEETAEATLDRLERTLVNMTYQMQEQIDYLTMASTMSIAVAFASIVISIVVVVVVLVKVRGRR